MDRVAVLSKLLKKHYGAEVVNLHALSLSPDHHGPSVYSVEQPHLPLWVLRACPQECMEEDLDAHAAVLRYLERSAYPTTRLIPSHDGQEVIKENEWEVMVMTYVRGTQPDYTPSSLQKLGAALGKLHALEIRSPEGSHLPPSGWEPELKIQEAREGLDFIAGDVPAEMALQFQSFRDALRSLPLSRSLPKALVHSDCYPGNAVVTAEGDLLLLNWSDAGVAPAVIDVGHTLLTCSTALPWAPEMGPNRIRIRALMQGYCRFRQLSPLELDALADAIRLAPAVMAAENYAAARVGSRGEGQWRLWWSRYLAAEGVAEVAREECERMG